MKKSKVILTVVITVLVLLIAGSGGYILFKNISNQKSSEKYDSLASSYAKLPDSTAGQTGDEKSQGKANPIDFASLKSENPDIYSWITVPGTEVNYPVLQSDKNDNFYIDHGVDKQPSFAGAIYSQFCNHLDYSDRVTVLYGHNMADNSMFASLHSFEDADFFDSHGDMTIYTPDRQLDYTIVSAFVFDDVHIMNCYDFSKDEVYRDFLDTVLNPHTISGNVRKGVQLEVDDRLVILSTCLNYGEGRYLVVGKLTKETPLSAYQ